MGFREFIRKVEKIYVYCLDVSSVLRRNYNLFWRVWWDLLESCGCVVKRCGVLRLSSFPELFVCERVSSGVSE